MRTWVVALRDAVGDCALLDRSACGIVAMLALTEYYGTLVCPQENPEMYFHPDSIPVEIEAQRI